MKTKSLSPLEVCQAAITKKHTVETLWLELAANLKEIRDDGLWEGRWESFEDFLQDPSMGMDKATASKMITIHEKLVIEYGIPTKEIADGGGWSVIAEVLPVITDVESAKEWVERAASLSKSDLRKEVNEARGKVTNGIGCKHPNVYTYTTQCCRDCGHQEVIKTNE